MKVKSNEIPVKKVREMRIEKLEHPAIPGGNKLLLQNGAIGFPHLFREDRRELRGWLEAKAAQTKPEPHQPGLF